MAWSVDWRVLIDGANVTVNMRPYLIGIEVEDKAGTASDACRLTFDDSGGQCLFPASGARVQVFLEAVQIFEGKVDSTPWRLARGDGRILTVAAKGLDTRGKAKEGQLWHLDDASLEAALQKAAGKAGIAVIVDPELGTIQRDYWSPEGASFLAWGEKLAREFGATFKVRADRAVFVKRGKGTAGSGGALPVVVAAVGRNLLTADIDPTKGRARFKQKRVRYFDRASASFMEKTLDIENGEDPVEAVDTQRWNAADAGQADSMAAGQKADAEREAGLGRVTIDLAVEAQAEGTCILSGARPGIDGTYRIIGVTHRADRAGGSTTALELAQPQGEAGKDSRKPAVPAAVPTPR